MLRDSAAVDTPGARPHFIAQDGHHLFAWHHPRGRPCDAAHAVVLCPPLGGEFVRAYRVWRILAEQLASIGFDVFRFDYEGTGDSAGDVTEPGRVEAWLRNIDRVVKEAREAHRLERSCTRRPAHRRHVGASRGGRSWWRGPSRDVESHSVPAEPYVRELKALSRLAKEPYVTKKEDGPDILAAGYLLPGPVASALEQLDVDVLPASPAPHVLLVERDDRSPDPGWESVWRDSGPA